MYDDFDNVFVLGAVALVGLIFLAILIGCFIKFFVTTSIVFGGILGLFLLIFGLGKFWIWLMMKFGKDI